jgi:hypothetical protein
MATTPQTTPEPGIKAKWTSGHPYKVGKLSTFVIPCLVLGRERRTRSTWFVNFDSQDFHSAAGGAPESQTYTHNGA